MKAFMRICCLLSVVLFFVGCGKMETNRQTAGDIFREMHRNGEIGDEHLAYLEANVNPATLNQSVKIIQISDTSLIMQVGDRRTTIDIERDSGENAPVTAMTVNGTTLKPKSEESRRKSRNLLETLLGLFEPDERDEIEGNLGFNLGDLIDLGYAEDRDDAELIALGTLIINALRKFRKDNPDKPFVALYAFGNSAEAILHNKSASGNTQDKKDNGNNVAQVISGVGLIVAFFNPFVGILIRALGALAS